MPGPRSGSGAASGMSGDHAEGVTVTAWLENTPRTPLAGPPPFYTAHGPNGYLLRVHPMVSAPPCGRRVHQRALTLAQRACGAGVPAPPLSFSHRKWRFRWWRNSGHGRAETLVRGGRSPNRKQHKLENRDGSPEHASARARRLVAAGLRGRDRRRSRHSVAHHGAGVTGGA